MKSSRSRFTCLLSLLMVFTLFGCGSDRNKEERLKALSSNNMRKLANAYKLFANVYDQSGPGSVEEFKKFLTTNKAITRNLEMMELDPAKVDEYFVSAADGEEFQFRWGVKINPELSIEPLIFDSTGVDGMRRIMLGCNVILDVTDDEKYGRLMDGKITKKDVPAYVFGGGIDEAAEQNAAP